MIFWRASLPSRKSPPRPSADNEDTSLGYDLAESAMHNAYHFGQIAFVRRALNLWPPSGGDEHDW